MLQLRRRQALLSHRNNKYQLNVSLRLRMKTSVHWVVGPSVMRTVRTRSQSGAVMVHSVARAWALLVHPGCGCRAGVPESRRQSLTLHMHALAPGGTLGSGGHGKPLPRPPLPRRQARRAHHAQPTLIRLEPCRGAGVRPATGKATSCTPGHPGRCSREYTAADGHGELDTDVLGPPAGTVTEDNTTHTDTADEEGSCVASTDPQKSPIAGEPFESHGTERTIGHQGVQVGALVTNTASARRRVVVRLGSRVTAHIPANGTAHNGRRRIVFQAGAARESERRGKHVSGLVRPG